jgi:hypothetical protein
MLTRRSFHIAGLLFLGRLLAGCGISNLKLSSPTQNNSKNMMPFNISSYKDFDSTLARKLAELVQQAYTQFDKGKQLQPWNISESYTLVQTLTDKDPFGFIATDSTKKEVFIVIRGTKTFLEWFKDSQIQLVSYRDGINSENPDSEPSIIIKTSDDYGHVTKGFRRIYVNLRSQIIDALNQCPKDARVYITGHSLGSALATLAIPDILSNTHFNDPQKIVMYTFASPRCGDRTFAEIVQKTRVQHWRIANTEDIVTSLPFPTGNVFKPSDIHEPPDEKTQQGAREGNLMFQFLVGFYNNKKRRMPEYSHTGNPIYFTIHEGALERHHNLAEVYMKGINQSPLS